MEEEESLIMGESYGIKKMLEANETYMTSTSFNSNIKDLVVFLGFQNQRIALEVNELIIPKSKYSTFLLNDNDKVEVINAVGGG